MPDRSNSNSSLAKLSEENRLALRDMFQHPGWQVCQQWLADQWDSCHRRLASQEGLVEIYRTQGEIRAYGRVNDLREILMPKPTRR